MKLLYSILLFLATVSLAIGQNDSTIASGDWDNSSNWKDGTMPGVKTTGTPDSYTSGSNKIVVSHDMTINGDFEFNNTIDFTVIDADLTIDGDVNAPIDKSPNFNFLGSSGSNVNTITIKGDLNFEQNNNSQVFLYNTVLIIEGDLNNLNGSNVVYTVSDNSIIYVKGNFNMSQSKKLQMSGSGAFLVDGSSTLGGLDGNIDGNIMVGGNMDWSNANFDGDDEVYLWSDDNDGNGGTQNDNRNSPYKDTINTQVSGVNGNLLAFAQNFPYLCAFSDVCRSQCIAAGMGSGCSSGPLPVTWSDVYVEEALGLVTVYWSTLSETDNDYFEVYKSTDAENWTSIGVVSGAGISKELLSYSLTDVETATEVTYYRVAQVDYDGASEFSKTVVYVPGEGLSSSEGLYPNPNAGSFYVDLGEDELLSVSIASSKGESVAFDYAILENLVKVEVDPAYASGFYTVTLITNSGVTQKNFIIK